MSREHEEMLARVRVSDRMWCEADLYWRTNRWEEDVPDLPGFVSKEAAEHHLNKDGARWDELAQLWFHPKYTATIKRSGFRWEIEVWW
jgi:hypothetical protein